MIKVLIVEDDPMVATINARFLERVAGYSLVGLAPSLEEARRIIGDQKPELILLDLFLPRASGMDLLRWIRETGLGLDVILITADSTSARVREALRYGAVDYLIKPFTFERFQEALERYAQRRQEMARTETLSQEELDGLLVSPPAETPDVELEKGINKYTLQIIWKELIGQGENYSSAEAISEHTGVASVTVRRYLNFLERDGQVERLVEYGRIGRPQHRYRMVQGRSGSTRR